LKLKYIQQENLMNDCTANFLQFLISFKYLFLRTALFWVITRRSDNFLTLEDGANRLSRNVGKKLPLHAA